MSRNVTPTLGPRIKIHVSRSRAESPMVNIHRMNSMKLLNQIRLVLPTEHKQGNCV